MTTMNRRVRHYDEADALREAGTAHPRFSHGTMMWVAIGTTAAGIGTNLYGANKQAKTQARTDDQNRAAIEKADQSAWNNYLLQRGLYGGNAPTGTIPGMQPGAAVNARLPLWATMSFPQQGTTAGSVVRRKTPRVV